MPTFENKNAATVSISKSKYPRELYEHQIEAMQALGRIDEKSEFNALVVLPTGAGKTLTSVYWLLRNAVNKNDKILWIAHRHLLLDQAAEAFVSNGYKDVISNRLSYKYRIISGIHDRPIHIEGDEDILICGKDSIIKRLDCLDEWMAGNDLYLVIDEAHHAVAHTYQRIIEYVKDKAKENNAHVKMIGLTATPYRTDEDEKAALGQIFTDDIVYKVDLDTLIKKQILSTPICKTYETHVLAGENVNSSMIRNIAFTDNLPEDLAKEIAENSQRNHLIVQKYLENQEEFEQTIVFALNVRHAIELNAIFSKYGVKSNYIVTGLRDAVTGISRSKEDNAKAIEEYRNKEIQVLINVNILTEGTDLPQTKTVFLARPTVSKVLMTQMVGRALRGEKAGGTKEAYIISFVDDWEDKISFESPESILMDGQVPDRNTPEYRKQQLKYVAVSMIEEFARIVDETVDTEALENLPYSERIPLGMYMVTYLEEDPENETSIERNHSVLVYNSSKDAYEAFLNDMDVIMERYSIDGDRIGDGMIERMITECRSRYFANVVLPPCKNADIEALLKYYAFCRKTPKLTTIEAIDRAKINLSFIAQDILDLELSDFKKRDYLKDLWNDDETMLKLYYTEFNYFKRQLDKEINKIVYTDPDEKSIKPKVIYDERELEKLTLQEIIERDPRFGLKLKEQVFEASKKDGSYICAYCKMTSPNRKDFQIDHIKPMSKGGLTVRDNLQLLCRKCNWVKSDHEDDLPLAYKDVSDDVIPNVVHTDKDITVTIGEEEKRFDITADRRKRGYMTFQIGKLRYLYDFKKKKIEIMR